MGEDHKRDRSDDRSSSRSPAPRDRHSAAASSGKPAPDRRPPNAQVQHALQHLDTLVAPPPTSYPNGVAIPGVGTDTNILQALSVNTKLSQEVLVQLIEALGSDKDDDADDFGFLTAARITKAIDELPDMKPMTAGKLLEQCRIVAERVCGAVAHGMHGMRGMRGMNGAARARLDTYRGRRGARAARHISRPARHARG